VIAVIAWLAFFAVCATPLVLLWIRPLTRHRHAAVRFVARTLAMMLLWLAFDVSLMAIWGAVRFVPAWWAALIGFLPLQIPACRISYRLVFEDDEPTT
jgi:hypothetical protein